MISKLKMVNCRYMNVVKNIREIRLQKSISQSAIADELGVDVAVISNIEKGKRELRVSELEKIAKVLRMSVIDILTYPKIFVESTSNTLEPVEAILQIRLQKDKKDQVLKLVFGENNLEILNR
ncbi:hypothetical protein KML24003_11580 [Alistipes finegoldii]|jgi:hypothetical protein|nr:XRE family transcriptional regulator [Alistipes onderdonkii]